MERISYANSRACDWWLPGKVCAVGRALAAAVFLLFTLLGSASTAQTAPTITGIGFTADPTGGREYHTTGDTIVIAVNFSENITVNPAPPYDEDDSAVPTIDLEIGNSIKAVRLHGEYGDFVLFIYTVQERDTDLDGNFRLLANSLRLNGATIRSSGDMADANLSHEEKTCCGHNVITLTERLVLEILYDETGGDSWTRSTNWKTSEPLGMWHGVTTNTEGQVTAMNIRSNQLSGEIPSELGNLTNLEWLFLASNQLSGEIPSELGNLTSLTRLLLAGNQLSGEIPSELGNLTSLTGLLLAGNQLSGEIPSELGNLTSLTELVLNDNQLSGEIPSELGNLTSLTGLQIVGNQLSGEIPSELGNLTSLRILALDNNQLSGEIPSELGNLTMATFFSLANNQLSGEIPSELGNLTNVTTLQISDNRFSGEIPSELGGITSLQSLYLDNNMLSGNIPAELGNLTSLKRLWLSGNQLSGEIPSELGNLTNLQEVALHRNQLSGEIPSELGNLTSLQRLYLHINRLSGEIPAELGNLTNLRELLLYTNQLSGEIPSELGNLTSLQRLYLRGNQLSGEIPLTELEALTDATRSRIFLELALWDNDGLTGTESISDELGKRVDRAVLSTLYLVNGGREWYSTEVSRNTPQAWRPFSGDYVLSFGDWYGVDVNNDGRVSKLNLNDNNLKGPITNALEELEHLETLNLADNPMLSGILPNGLFSEDTKLTKLNIQNTNICVPNTQAFKEWLDSSDTVFTVGECSFIFPESERTPEPEPTPETPEPEPTPETPEPEPTPETPEPEPTPETPEPEPTPETPEPEPTPETPEPEPTPETPEPEPTPNISGGCGGGCAIASEGWAGYRLGSALLNLFLVISSPLWVLLGSRLGSKRGGSELPYN